MISTTTFYSSSNGDRWQMLHDDETGLYQVRHEPNAASGGRATDTLMPEFLSRSGATPQGLALQKLLEEQGAIDPDLED
ncbi:hypothetical protein [Rhodopila sp.]|uniref:hypothetical protein n=1 Tax=Rhodopila sp. TaxID=2480087 RepID=UPI003D135263